MTIESNNKISISRFFLPVLFLSLHLQSRVGYLLSSLSYFDFQNHSKMLSNWLSSLVPSRAVLLPAKIRDSSEERESKLRQGYNHLILWYIFIRTLRLEQDILVNQFFAQNKLTLFLWCTVKYWLNSTYDCTKHMMRVK